MIDRHFHSIRYMTHCCDVDSLNSDYSVCSVKMLGATVLDMAAVCVCLFEGRKVSALMGGAVCRGAWGTDTDSG